MNIDKDKTVFLLGGHDLEMLSIKEILIKEEIRFVDKELKWGARLSCYKNELEQFSDYTIYGLELEEDMALAKNYHRIDHHNDFWDKEASIIQVLELLGKDPTREQLLIAHNDVGHIEAMRCFGGTKQEIQEIRKRDRAIQGVTAKEEAQALEEIEKIKEEDGMYVLETSLEKFSPIVDNFEKRPLLLYSAKSLTYYGDIAFLKEQYKEQIAQNQAYHGRGFFGFDSKYVGSISSNKLAKEILEMKKEIISYHNFMFPFRFDRIIDKPIQDKHDFYKTNSFDNRVKIDTLLKESLESNRWRYQKFEIKNGQDYNELVYFHDFVKDTLFNTEEFEEKATSYYFEKELEKGATFEIKIKDKNHYVLKLEGVNLRLFDTGVGILSFEVENYAYKEFDDILKINEYGRRIYPQFLEYDYGVDKTKEAFLADSVVVNGIEEHFNKKYTKIEIAKYILEILGEESFSTNKEKIGSNFIQPIIDDRMFVLSWYGNDVFSQSLKQRAWVESDNWYKYVFVDGNDKMVQDAVMQEAFIKKATYSRWNEYGTLYGITRYSFTSLTDESFGRDVILPHMKTLYFQMVTLLLAQRASLLRFSDEITAISDVQGEEKIDKKNLVKNISILYKNYLRFVNKLYFKEITAQDQGIELYDKALNILNIKRDIEDLRQEIGTLNGYAFLEQEREEKEQMNQLTRLGTFLIPPTLVAGFFGMNVFGKESLDIEGIGWLIGAIALTLTSPFIVKYFTDKEKK